MLLLHNVSSSNVSCDILDRRRAVWKRGEEFCRRVLQTQHPVSAAARPLLPARLSLAVLPPSWTWGFFPWSHTSQEHGHTRGRAEGTAKHKSIWKAPVSSEEL